MVANSLASETTAHSHNGDPGFFRTVRPHESTPSDSFSVAGAGVTGPLQAKPYRHQIIVGALVLLIAAAAGLSGYPPETPSLDASSINQAIPAAIDPTGDAWPPAGRGGADPHHDSIFPDSLRSREATTGATVKVSARGRNDDARLQAGNRGGSGAATPVGGTGQARDIDVTAPLNLAAINGDFDIVELLLANGSDVNSKSRAGSYPGETPLHSVAYAGHTRIAELLLDYGANVNATDQYRYTPLRRTVEQGHLAMTELLIRKGADIVTRDTNGQTLLHVVARTDHVEIARLLITGGVDINAMDGSGFTPLDYAQGGETRMASTLQQLGAICTIC